MAIIWRLSLWSVMKWPLASFERSLSYQLCDYPPIWIFPHPLFFILILILIAIWTFSSLLFILFCISSHHFSFILSCYIYLLYIIIYCYSLLFNKYSDSAGTSWNQKYHILTYGEERICVGYGGGGGIKMLIMIGTDVWWSEGTRFACAGDCILRVCGNYWC